MNEANNNKEQDDKLFEHIDPNKNCGAEDQGNESESSDLATEILKVTVTIGVLKKEMPNWLLYEAGKCAQHTANALHPFADKMPPCFMQHTVVAQGVNLIPAGTFAVETPPAGDPEWAAADMIAFDNHFHRIALSIEGCPYALE